MPAVRFLLVGVLVIGAIPRDAVATRVETVIVDGEAVTPTGRRNVRLEITCDSLGLAIPDIEETGFDFRPFQGMYAPARRKALSRLQLTSARGVVETTLPANLSYRREETTSTITFVFGMTFERGVDVVSFVRAIASTSAGATVRWTQKEYYRVPPRVIDATFAIGDSHHERLRGMVRRCDQEAEAK